MLCPDHDNVTVGACETCGREVCEICLEEAEFPEDFECPECGEYGVAMYDDHDYPAAKDSLSSDM